MGAEYFGPAAVARDEAGIGVDDVRSNATTTASIPKQDGLIAGHHAAMAAILRRELITAGVPADLDADVRCAPITPRDDGSFDFADDGRLAVLLPVDPDAPSDDCIAFFVSAPGRWWSHSAAAILNPAAVEHAAWFRTSLRLHPTPLDYLKAGATGAVIVNWRENLRWWLGDVRTIECPSLAYQRRLAHALRQPPPPQLIYGSRRSVAA